jgi:hypothetical protein
VLGFLTYFLLFAATGGHKCFGLFSGDITILLEYTIKFYHLCSHKLPNPGRSFGQISLFGPDLAKK